jgi:hypothetical protein
VGRDYAQGQMVSCSFAISMCFASRAVSFFANHTHIGFHSQGFKSSYCDGIGSN